MMYENSSILFCTPQHGCHAAHRTTGMYCTAATAELNYKTSVLSFKLCCGPVASEQGAELLRTLLTVQNIDVLCNSWFS